MQLRSVRLLGFALSTAFCAGPDEMVAGGDAGSDANASNPSSDARIDCPGELKVYVEHGLTLFRAYAASSTMNACMNDQIASGVEELGLLPYAASYCEDFRNDSAWSVLKDNTDVFVQCSESACEGHAGACSMFRGENTMCSEQSRFTLALGEAHAEPFSAMAYPYGMLEPYFAPAAVAGTSAHEVMHTQCYHHIAGGNDCIDEHVSMNAVVDRCMVQMGLVSSRCDDLGRCPAGHVLIANWTGSLASYNKETDPPCTCFPDPRRLSLDENEVSDDFGSALASADFDGDHYSDVAVAAPGENASRGAVYVFRGTKFGLVPWQRLDQAGHREGEAGDAFGSALVAGRLDGDSFDDLAVGMPDATHDGLRRGYVMLFRGSAEGLEAWNGVAAPSVVRSGGRFGATLSLGRPGCKEGGPETLLVGAPGDGAGSVSFWEASDGAPPGPLTLGTYLTPPSIEPLAFPDGAEFGAAIAVGRFDESTPECRSIAIGAPGAAGGVVAIYSSRRDSPELESMLAITNATRVGESVVSANLDGDERDDLAVSGIDGSGAVLALYHNGGSPHLWTLKRHVELPGAGETLTLSAGNIDAEGTDEIVVGAPGGARSEVTSGLGAIVRPSGAIVYLDQADRDTNESGDRFGASVAVGDFNRDGQADIAVGAPGEHPGSDPGSGCAFTFISRGPERGRPVDPWTTLDQE